jgi:uncharacterized membrane protein YdfJ with MMPL/SSD domain
VFPRSSPQAEETARLPIFALAVVGLSLLLLAITFRSIKVAALSAVFNLVSIAAAYGIIHLLFQTDTGASLISVATPGFSSPTRRPPAGPMGW